MISAYLCLCRKLWLLVSKHSNGIALNFNGIRFLHETIIIFYDLLIFVISTNPDRITLNSNTIWFYHEIIVAFSEIFLFLLSFSTNVRIISFRQGIK